MNRQQIYLLAATWLMLVLLIGCMPTTSQADVVDSDETATAVLPTTAAPTVEELEMNDDETEIPATIVPQPEKPTPQDAYPPSPAQGAAAKPTIPVPASPVAQERIEKAQADLANMLSIDAAQIELVEYQSVTWRDGSLGCPRPGMAYTQALVEGYRIQLQVEGVQYDYHGATGDPFYCPNPAGKFDPGGASGVDGT